MTPRDPKATDRQRAEDVDANIDQAFNFFDAVLEDPSVAETLPDGATVVVLPSGDPDRARANLDLATAAGEAGRNVFMWNRERGAIQYRHVTPVWPKQAHRLKMVLDYYREGDTLVAHFVGRFDAEHPPSVIPANQYMMFYVDLRTSEVVGLLIPDFLSRVVRIAPHVLSWLSLARLHGISQEEVKRMLLEWERPPRRNANAETLRRELMLLTA